MQSEEPGSGKRRIMTVRLRCLLLRVLERGRLRLAVLGLDHRHLAERLAHLQHKRGRGHTTMREGAHHHDHRHLAERLAHLQDK